MSPFRKELGLPYRHEMSCNLPSDHEGRCGLYIDSVDLPHLSGRTWPLDGPHVEPHPANAPPWHGEVVRWFFSHSGPCVHDGQQAVSGRPYKPFWSAYSGMYHFFEKNALGGVP